MKKIQVLIPAACILIAVTSIHAWSQGGKPASAPVVASDTTAMAASSTVEPATGRKADRALRRKVYAAIGKHKDINAGNISVIARDGAVTLNGSVTEVSQVDQVAQIAKGVAGVTSVTNKLTVKKPFGGM